MRTSTLSLACNPDPWASDDSAVVSHELKVHGIDRLRVADVSIMPRLVSGGFNNPSIMIGEKTSGMILADHPKLRGAESAD